MHCHQVRQLLVEYLDGELDEKTKAELEDHLKDCEPCQKFISTYKATVKITKKADPGEMPVELKDRLKSFIENNLGKEMTAD